MFKAGDLVVHKVYGVCRIEKISALEEISIPKNKLYYILTPIYENESVLYIPVEKSNKLRSVISKDKLYEIVDSIEEIETLWVEDEKQREKSYKLALESAEVIDWIRIIRTIYLRKKQRNDKGKKITSADGKYIRIAENLLYGEMAVVLKKDRNSIQDFITQRAENKSAVK